MYSLKNTIAQPMNQRGVWDKVDISTTFTKELLKLFAEAYITIYSKILDRDITISLSSIKDRLSTFDGTFTAFLEENKNKSFEEIDFTVSLKERILRYEDGVRAGYKFYPAPSIHAVDSEHGISDRPYIKFEKKYNTAKGKVSIDPLEFYKYCLVSVNGFIHRVDVSKDEMYIIDGYKSVRQANDNAIGILSFKELGSIDVIPITKDMIYKQVDSALLYDQCFIDIGKDTSDKTIILILGGYLHVLDWLVFRRISDTAIRIDLKNIPFLERFHESKRYISFADAPLDRGHDDDHVAVSDITGDRFIRYYLQMPQSFILLLDNTDIHVSRQDVVTTMIPGQYISYVEPKAPLIDGHGKFANYWSVWEDDEWVLNTRENQYHNWVYDSASIFGMNSVTNSRYTQELSEASLAYMLRISSMIEKKKK